MPIYEYGCEAGHRFEVKQKISDAPIATCQVCDLPVTKLVSPPAIMFKGSGWYVTDYSDKLKPVTTEGKSEVSPGSKTEGGEKSAPPAPTTPAASSASTPSSNSGTESASTTTTPSGS